LGTTKARIHILLALFAAALVLAACSDGPEPTTGRLLVPSEPATSQEATARQAGEPAVARAANEPANASLAPVLHILGSVRDIADPAASFAPNADVIEADLATIATLGCAASTCSPDIVAEWASGQLQIMNVATLAAAIEGPDSLEAQVDALEAAGVATLGFGSDLQTSVEPILIGPAESEVAIHAISLAPDTQSLATNSSAGVAGPEAIDLLRESVIFHRNSGRGVVVIVDWGNLEGRSPTGQQLDDVDRIINAGADAIVGHGSDFLQRFDLVGQTAVAFSLGNASTSASEPLLSDTALLRLEFDSPGRSCLLPATASPSGPSLDDPTLTACAQ